MKFLKYLILNTRYLILFLTLTAGYLLLAADVHAKDYSITAVNFNVQLNSDGSAEVVEERTYNFNGDYHWIDEWIDLRSKIKNQRSKISDFELSEGGKTYAQSPNETAGNYQLSITADKVYFKAWYEANYESKTFTLRYKIDNAIINQSDIAEFYWQLIGSEWQIPNNNISATVMLPSPASASSALGRDGPSNQIWGFGHGPLNGVVSIPTNQKVTFTADNLSAGTFFEVRVLFPKLEGAVFAQNGTVTLQQILAEEKGFIDKTVKEKEASSKGVIVGLIVNGILSLFFWIGIIRYLVVRRKDGPGIPLPEANLSGTLHEPPSDLPPAMVEGLLKVNKNRYSPNVFLAEILFLVQKKIIKISSEKKNTFFGSTKYEYSLEAGEKFGEQGGLHDFDQGLINFIFDQGESDQKVSFADIKKTIQKTPTASFEFFKDFKKDSYQNLLSEQVNLLEKVPKGIKKKAGFLIIISLALQVVMLVFGPLSLIGLAFNSIIAIFVTVGFPLGERRTPAGLVEASKWKAFEKWLKDYSVTKNYPVDSIILWEKYLVYGTLFGVSIKTLASLPVSFSREEFSSYLVANYGISHSGDFTTFASDLNSSLQSMSSSFSNSFSGGYGSHGVGSSGGFSGGGGGAGGGGGGGGGGAG